MHKELNFLINIIYFGGINCYSSTMVLFMHGCIYTSRDVPQLLCNIYVLNSSSGLWHACKADKLIMRTLICKKYARNGLSIIWCENIKKFIWGEKDTSMNWCFIVSELYLFDALKYISLIFDGMATCTKTKKNIMKIIFQKECSLDNYVNKMHLSWEKGRIFL